VSAANHGETSNESAIRAKSPEELDLWEMFEPTTQAQVTSVGALETVLTNVNILVDE
tara:strand:+ start:288 stop:458 length:171 start_codon:yes stop_codon:yes gene_type:complete